MSISNKSSDLDAGGGLLLTVVLAVEVFTLVGGGATGSTFLSPGFDNLEAAFSKGFFV